ncbi:MAG: pantoate kinase [Candidatus Hydrothermarchaeales archaeon]
MRASAFVPGHITGFFKPVKHREYLRYGSIGCGVVISKGVYTNVRVREAEKNALHIFIDGEEKTCPVTEAVARDVLKLADGRYKAEIFHEVDIPISQGFGSSAAGALGTALCLSKALQLPLTLNHCGGIAHRAEVRNKTGLGDVIAEYYGGLVVRLAPGAPGIGVIDKIPCEDYVVAWVVGEPLDTKTILLNKKKSKRISSMAEKSMESLFRYPNPENFLQASRRFALDSQLMSKEVYSAVKILEEKNIPASMVMLGNSVFTLTRDPERVEHALDCPSIVAEIDSLGARTV